MTLPITQTQAPLSKTGAQISRSAFLVMPLLLPLADLFGVTRQVVSLVVARLVGRPGFQLLRPLARCIHLPRPILSTSNLIKL